MSEDTPQGAIEHTLHEHTRAITDINFSASHPDMLATCAVDGYVHCWDLRRPRQPVHTFVDWFAGATQVKYNRQDPHILASSHDRWLRIWDIRKGAVPVRSINAHESKIYGVDWNRTRATSLATCSLDKSIKFWDYAVDLDDPERIIRTDYPVWRARFTPFGWGVLAMPQDTPGHVHLYDTRLREDQPKDSAVQVAKTFPGHGNHKVKEFLWRSRGGVTDEGIDDREFQLVTWGEDNELRLKPVDAETLHGVGYVKGTQLRARLNVTRKGSIYRTFRSIDGASADKKPTTASGPRPMTSGIRVSALSAGMKSRTGSQGSRGLSITRPSTMKGKHKSRKGDQNHQQQIGWMSGIRISKQENGASKRPPSRRLSLLQPEFEEEDEWDAPETWQEEIIRIHKQLPKIAFDNVDMDKRIVNVSMNGPWGWGGEPIYVKVAITFPAQYPEGQSPTFNIGKTSLLSVPMHDKIKKELGQIASRCLTSRKGCLQATLCYLLGEASAEASTAFLKLASDIEQDIEDVTVESSSDEEGDENLANSSTMLSQELESSATGDMLGNMSRNSKVPLPNRCGARFARNGQLVCFFPPQIERYKKLFDKQDFDDPMRTRGESGFEAFGRLYNNGSPVPRIKTYSTVDESRILSDASDESDTSSSSDSDSSNFPTARFRMTDYWRNTSRRNNHRSPTIVSQKSSAAGTGTTNMGKVKMKPRNTVEIYDVNTFLPSKVELAKHYIIFGPGPDVCRHNADVASKYGLQELADIWKYAGLLLNNEVPLDVFDKGDTDPVLVMAKTKPVRSGSSSNSSDSGIELSFDRCQKPAFSGRVKWGHNPLAKRLISDLFDYYIKLADTQMLAMLSCIFSEPPSKEPIPDAEPQSALPRTPLSQKTPAFSLEYFPTDAAAWNNQQKVATIYGSAGSGNETYGSDPTSYSTGETPPFKVNIDHGNHQSLSTSPENARYLRRTNSGLGAAFVSSFARPFSTSSSSSPPVGPNQPRKRPGQVESMLNSAITWGNNTVLGAVKEQVDADEMSDDEDLPSQTNAQPTTGINIAMINQSAFDDEGSMNTTLLDPADSHLFERYRLAYADLLFSWHCPLARLEILKFNQLRDEYLLPLSQTDQSLQSPSHLAKIRPPPPPSPIILGRRDAIRPAPYGLDVTGYCLKHESRLAPLPSTTIGGAAGRCERCKQTQKQLRCIICLESIVALYPACLSCGCVTHQACLEEYHEQDGGTMCPGGCDCECGIRASKGLVESWEGLMGELGRLKTKDSETEGWDWAFGENSGQGRGGKSKPLGRADGRRRSVGVW